MFRNILLFLFSAAALMAQQDLTVQWKASLQDLEQRAASLPTGGGSTMAAWRADEEATRTSIADFAGANPGMKLQCREPCRTARRWQP